MCYVTNEQGYIVAGPMSEQAAMNMIDGQEELFIMHDGSVE